MTTPEMPDLWSQPEPAWRRALDHYEEVVGAQRSKRLPELDRWYRNDLPKAIAGRSDPHVTRGELVKVTEWKMARGIWRGRNLHLVKGNSADEVAEATREGLSRIPDERAPIMRIAKLSGVGPATASAVVAAAAPERYPFFDDLVAAQVPGLGGTKFTMTEYLRYTAELRNRAEALGGDWTPALVERALWASSGGKTAAKG